VGTVDETVDSEVVALLFTGIVVMLLLALALVAFFLIYQKKLVSQQLTLQTLQSAYQKELLVATIEAEERERQRIGSDLHDEIGSSLSAAKMLMSQVAESEVIGTKEHETITLIQDILRNSLQDVRNISQNLHPAVLARFGLAQALHNLGLLCTDAFAGGVAVQVEFDTVLPQSHELAIYRIVQEVLNNALKHAQATHVTISLQQQAQRLTLTVEDDGRGFDYAKAGKSKTAGLGLKSLAARVSLLDAALHLESAPGRGTRVQIDIPLYERPC
jgi:two-component system NarL family sensor kinase